MSLPRWQRLRQRLLLPLGVLIWSRTHVVVSGSHAAAAAQIIEGTGLEDSLGKPGGEALVGENGEGGRVGLHGAVGGGGGLEATRGKGKFMPQLCNLPYVKL